MILRRVFHEPRERASLSRIAHASSTIKRDSNEAWLALTMVRMSQATQLSH
jgi:hypothetical protein